MASRVGSAPQRTFSAGDLASWLRGGDAARSVGGAERGHVFSTVTMSSLPDGSPPMLPGGLFVAIKVRRDGHDFVGNAFRNGAAAALVTRIPEHLAGEVERGAMRVWRPSDGALAWDGRPTLFLTPPRQVASPVPGQTLGEDAMAALQGCAAWWRRQHAVNVIAITGSVGKTTTKDLLSAILVQRGMVLSTRGNFNNELGLPFMLLELTPEYRFAVLEIGISAVGEMESFAAIAGPDAGIVTRVAPAHLEQFGDIDTVEREKGRLVEALPPSGVAVLNADDSRVARMAERTGARVVTFGRENAANVRAEAVVSLGFDGVRFTLGRGVEQRTITLALVGEHFVTCALAAAAAAFEAGATWDEVVAGLETRPAERRMEPIRLPNGATLLDDTYNASPAAMRAALDVLAVCAGRRIAVLGDMFELGVAGPDAHHEVGAYVPGHADELVAVGELGRYIAEGALEAGMPLERVTWNATPAEVSVALTPRLTRGDFVLIKGSRGMRMDEIVAALAGEHLSTTHRHH
jgi:UDP-N-acetylmuramoyl-tripeptide--D-alanyl-D-alanine ligase